MRTSLSIAPYSSLIPRAWHASRLDVTAALLLRFGETYFVLEILEPQRRGYQVAVIPIRPHRPVIHEDTYFLAWVGRVSYGPVWPCQYRNYISMRIRGAQCFDS